MFAPFFGRHVGGTHGGSVLGSVNLRITFRRISEVWENAETQNLERFLLYLSPITLKFLDFQTSLNSSDRSQRQNSVAATKFCSPPPPHSSIFSPNFISPTPSPPLYTPATQAIAVTMIFTCHTRRFIAETCRGDVSQRFVASCFSTFNANFQKKYLWKHIYLRLPGSLKPSSGICYVLFLTQ